MSERCKERLKSVSHSHYTITRVFKLWASSKAANFFFILNMQFIKDDYCTEHMNDRPAIMYGNIHESMLLFLRTDFNTLQGNMFIIFVD